MRNYSLPKKRLWQQRMTSGTTFSYILPRGSSLFLSVSIRNNFAEIKSETASKFRLHFVEEGWRFRTFSAPTSSFLCDRKKEKKTCTSENSFQQQKFPKFIFIRKVVQLPATNKKSGETSPFLINELGCTEIFVSPWTGASQFSCVFNLSIVSSG